MTPVWPMAETPGAVDSEAAAWQVAAGVREVVSELPYETFSRIEDQLEVCLVGLEIAWHRELVTLAAVAGAAQVDLALLVTDQQATVREVDQSAAEVLEAILTIQLDLAASVRPAMFQLLHPRTHKRFLRLGHQRTQPLLPATRSQRFHQQHWGPVAPTATSVDSVQEQLALVRLILARLSLVRLATETKFHQQSLLFQGVRLLIQARSATAYFQPIKVLFHRSNITIKDRALPEALRQV